MIEVNNIESRFKYMYNNKIKSMNQQFVTQNSNLS